jgi:hypothetical protein
MGGTGFTPEILIQSVWRCLILQICETVIIKFGLSIMQVPMAFLDVFAYTGYKYIGKINYSCFHVIRTFMSD